MSDEPDFRAEAIAVWCNAIGFEDPYEHGVFPYLEERMLRDMERMHLIERLPDGRVKLAPAGLRLGGHDRRAAARGPFVVKIPPYIPPKPQESPENPPQLRLFPGSFMLFSATEETTP